LTEFISLLIAGIVTGSVYAVSASGLVITYNTTGIFNFAQGALGLVLAYVFWQCWQGWGWNPVVSLVFVLLVVAPSLGVLLERAIMRPLYGSATTVSIVVTLGLLLLLFGVSVSIWSPTNTYTVPEFFAGHQVSLGSVNISIEQVITISVAIAVAVFFWLFFKHSRTGIAMRAVVDDPRLARMTGAPSGRISAYAWMIGVMLAGVSGILLAPTTMDATVLAELVIYGYAAAVVGRLRSVPLTFLGAMILGIVSSLAVGYVPESQLTNVTAALPMVLLFGVLLFMPEARLAIGRVARMRPPRTASLRATLVGAAVLIGIAVAGALLLTGANLSTLGAAFGIGLLALSLVPLSGYGGQVSLCQFTFAGLGALTMHWIGGGDSLLGLLAAAGLSGAAGAVLAVPALRLRGIYLALATLSFAVLMDNIFFNAPSIVGAGGIVTVGRVDLFGLHFQSDRVYVVLLSAVFALFLVAIGALRRGAFGRRLVAMQDSPVASTTLGASLVVTKLLVFSGSAALAGLAGALLSGMAGSASAQQFTFLQSIVLFVAVTLAGSRLLTSAVIAGATLAIAPVIGQHIPQLTDFTYLLIGVGIIAIGRNPNALGTLYSTVGDWWRRKAVTPAEKTRQPSHELPLASEEASVV
jgi:branched-chain amino acid transport system permease protein